MSTVKINVLVKNIKRERPDLAMHFSEHALTEIAKNEIIEDSSFANDINSLTVKCVVSLKNQFKTTRRWGKRNYYRIALNAIANVLLLR